MFIKARRAPCFSSFPKKSIEEIFEFEKLPARKFFIRVQRSYLENFTALEQKLQKKQLKMLCAGTL